MQKEFRKIPSLDFRYEVSRDGVVRNIKSKKIKKQQITQFGYYRTNYRVNKSNPNYKPNQGWDRPLHQLVMECWGTQKPSPNHIIDHIDRNKLNNHISNLRWVTKIENRNNIDKEAYSKTNSLAQLNSQKKKRVAVRLVNKNENLVFNSRFQAAQWLIDNGKTQTKNPKGLSRRIAIQKFVHGYEIYNINAERLG